MTLNSQFVVTYTTSEDFKDRAPSLTGHLALYGERELFLLQVFRVDKTT
jgi:hypothetical protein